MQPQQLVEVPFPLAGLEEYRSLTNGRVFNGKTSAASTQSALNVRGIDPLTGRSRGGTRPGLSKYNASQINGSEPIQDIISVVNPTQSNEAFVSQIQVDIATDPAGSASNGTGLLTTEGKQQHSAALYSKTDLMGPTCWDNYGYVYNLRLDDTANGFKVTKRLGATFVEQWTTSTFSSSTSTASSPTFAPLGLDVQSSIRNDAGAVTSNGTVYAYVRTSGSNLYEIWRFDAETGSILAADSSAAWKNANTVSGTISGLAQPTVGSTAIDNCLAYSNGYVGTLELTDGSNLFGRVINASTGSTGRTLLTGPQTGTASTYAINMVGDTTGNFYWSGQKGGDSTSKIGGLTSSTMTTSSASGYKMVAFSPVAKQLLTLNASAQMCWMDGALTETRTAQTITGSGWSCIFPAPSGGAVVSKLTNTRDATIVLVDANGAIVDFTTYTSSSIFSSIRYQFISVNQYLPLSANQLAYYRADSTLVTSGGTIKRIKNGAVESITQGVKRVKTNAPVVFSAQVDNVIYFADGETASLYNVTTNTAGAWSATAGAVPIDSSGGRASLIAAWRRRILLAGLKQEGNTLFGSALGNPLDFDTGPTNVLATTAFAIAFPDIINGMIPYNQDKCIIGCDHSLHQLTGDPMDGGNVDVISNTVGMAWGRAYCQSANGTIFFLGARGGVYQMAPGTIPQSISSTIINERLSRIDLSTSIVRMAWDDYEQGFYLFVSPIDRTTATVHYFFDARNGAWWPMSYSDVSNNGTVLYVIDGASLDDRRTVIGCGNGYLRQIDHAATTDDGTTIASYVYLGPFLNAGIGEIQLTTEATSSSLTLTTHVGEYAQEALAAAAGWTGAFGPGRARSQSPRRYGRAAYVKITGAGYWSLERLSLGISTGTPGRNRKG